jgi:hypothetical protein
VVTGSDVTPQSPDRRVDGGGQGSDDLEAGEALEVRSLYALALIEDASNRIAEIRSHPRIVR